MDFHLGERKLGTVYQLLQEGAVSKIFSSSYLNISFQFHFVALPCFWISIINEHLYFNLYILQRR